MGVKFTYYGGMCVLIERSDGYKILIDPYLTENEHTSMEPANFSDVDLILVTHHAADHYGDVEEIMRCSNARIMMCNDCFHYFRQSCDIPRTRQIQTIYGDERVFGPTTIRTVLANHISIGITNGVPTYGTPVGFIIKVEPGVVYYHPGDTNIQGDFKMLRELYRPNVMCVGIGSITPTGPREMTEVEAATAVSWIGAEVVIPAHYYIGSTAPETFRHCMAVIAPDVTICERIEQPFMFIPSQVISLEN